MWKVCTLELIRLISQRERKREQRSKFRSGARSSVTTGVSSPLKTANLFHVQSSKLARLNCSLNSREWGGEERASVNASADNRVSRIREEGGGIVNH